MYFGLVSKMIKNNVNFKIHFISPLTIYVINEGWTNKNYIYKYQQQKRVSDDMSQFDQYLFRYVISGLMDYILLLVVSRDSSKENKFQIKWIRIFVLSISYWFPFLLVNRLLSEDKVKELYYKKEREFLDRELRKFEQDLHQSRPKFHGPYTCSRKTLANSDNEEFWKTSQKPFKVNIIILIEKLQKI